MDKEIASFNLKTQIMQNAMNNNLNIMTALTALNPIFKDDALINIPKYESMRDLIEKKRKKLKGYITREFDDIPNNLRFDANGDLFMRFDSGLKDKNRFIIF